MTRPWKGCRCAQAGTCAAVVLSLVAHTSAGTCPTEQIVNAFDEEAADLFGYSVAIDGDTLVAGSFFDDVQGSGSGSAYVYGWDGTAWQDDTMLFALDGAAFDGLGRSVALDGDRIVVGADGDADAGFGAGAAYVFTRLAGVWDTGVRIDASDGDTLDSFGNAVSISGDVAVVAAWRDEENGNFSGSAYVYRYDGANWNETKIAPVDGAVEDGFGNAVSLSGDVLAIGAWRKDDAGLDAGAVYVYRHDGATWQLEDTLTSVDTTAGDQFGSGVSVDGDVMIIGAWKAEATAGAAYVFRWNGVDWLEETTLLAADGAADDQFGASVSISGDSAVIGAPNESENGLEAGACYVFRHDAGVWDTGEKHVGSTGGAGDMLGATVGVSGDFVVAGASQHTVVAANAGAAFVFFDEDCCPADLSGNLAVDFDDLLIVLSFWGPCPGCAADLSGDGVVGFDEVLAVLSGWGPC